MRKDQLLSFCITLFMGKQRSGKTLSLVDFGYNTLLEIKYQEDLLLKKKNLTKTEKKRLKILSNFELWTNLNLNKKIYGDYKIITPSELMRMYKEKQEISNKLLLFDDLFKDLDSRLHGKEKNRVLSYFTTEIGKKENILGYVSHFSNRIELRLRSMTENFIVCKKGKLYDIKFNNGKILKNVWREDKNYYKLEDEKELKRMVIKQVTYKEEIDFSKDYDSPEKQVYDVEYINAYPYFKHYDTKEII